MTRALQLSIVIPAAALLLLASLLAGPLVGEAEAACKDAHKSAYKITSKRARKATLCLFNNKRRAHGLKRLKEHRGPLKAAKKHTKQMLKRGCFDHQCPGEGDLVARVSSTSYLPCGCSWGLAENIAYGYGRKSTPKKIVKAWMSSSGHRANILNRSFEHAGIGVKPGSPSGGGNAATYTATFGYRD